MQFVAEEWEHNGCGGQPREYEPGKWDCTGCKGAWYAGADFFKYLARIVFVPRGTKRQPSASCKF